MYCIDAADKQTTVYCNITLSEGTYQAFVYAVKNHYWYQMYIDDLPIWGRTCLMLNNICCLCCRRLNIYYKFYYINLPSPPVDNIFAVVIVWSIRGGMLTSLEIFSCAREFNISKLSIEMSPKFGLQHSSCCE